MSKIGKSMEENAVCSVEVPNDLLDLWYEQRNSGGSMVDRLNESLTTKAITIRSSCERLEERIRVRACVVSKKMKNLTHHKKVQMKKRSSKINIYENEVTDVSELRK